ncbi:MAG: hypothetical protein AB7E10_09515 [Burkholderiaceae bacterium]
MRAPAALLLRLGARLRRMPGAIWLTGLALTTLAWWGAYWLRFNFEVPARYFGQMLQTTPLALLGMAAGLALLQVPRQSWRHVGLADLRRLAAGVALGGVLTTALVMGLCAYRTFRARCCPWPRCSRSWP